MKTLTVSRPQPIKILSILSLGLIIAWAASTGEVDRFGVLVYPAIIGLQTAREWSWQLTVTAAGLHERQGIGSPREFTWSQVESVIMPDSAWWRINPVLRIAEAPNIQMTAAEGTDAVLKLAQRKGKPIEGSIESISVGRSTLPWAILLGLTLMLLAGQLSGAA
ncbi:hypothetical protein [Euzebya tangerina]|uniref:hypothetical protein n=1 Tax=Euzebya tangerina TaxID=591198 RepID=UPI000E324852|nr:hypothetical protein [Euzebya tangerina]